MLDEQRESGAHEHRRKDQEEDAEDDRGGKIGAGGECRGPVEDAEGAETNECDAKLGNSKEENGFLREPRREPAADEAAQAETQHEGADDYGHGLGVRAVNGEKGALPDDLIDERRNAGEEK